MKVLLVGEYSRLHNSLKEGLIEKGHDVVIVSSGDGFKGYPADLEISTLIEKFSILHFIVKGIYKLLKIDLLKIEIALRLYFITPKLKDFDIVQLVNENSTRASTKTEKWFIGKLKKQNEKLFLLSCGTDYTSVSYARNEGFKYSILTPFENNSKFRKQLNQILKYTTKPYYRLHSYIFNNIEGVIASDIDYHIPLKGHPKYLGLIPNPINTDSLKWSGPNINDRIIIFHGINSLNYTKKGNVYFEEALKIIDKKYHEKVKITSSRDIPYQDYIKLYEECHILLDQVYAYDQGYNALEAMAKGKVVFTGAEQEWLDYYGLKEDTVAINALPDTEHIVKKLEWLILNPKKIVEISKEARAFIEKEHHYKDIASKYLETWAQTKA
ncbi:glycosyltransferase [Seonamhaeicola sp. ML3]|uniref:glycosyltransferase n=1 Tax=Seonamhaeicola sp. ML3 TaxID=2937786 RepID=UPI00200DF457|nr:glycosyltransferase [Seonamhaeicola sp. ML3]